MNKIVLYNMLWQCVYNGTETACPVWLWVVLGVVVLGFIGFLVWIIKRML